MQLGAPELSLRGRIRTGAPGSIGAAALALASSVKASSAARAIPIGTAATAASTNGIAGNA